MCSAFACAPPRYTPYTLSVRLCMQIVSVSAHQGPCFHVPSHMRVTLCRRARDARLREALVTYLRAQLLLGGLEGEGGALMDVKALLGQSLQQQGFRWSAALLRCCEEEGAESGSQEHSLLLLMHQNRSHFMVRQSA